MKSFNVFDGKLGCTTIACGPLATLVTAAKSFSGLNGIFLKRCGFALTIEPDVMKTV